MSDVLDDILDVRRKRIAESKQQVSFADLERQAKNAGAQRSFFNALATGTTINVIAEMKMKSPSAGVLKGNYDVAEIARNYEKGGARALSVLTEPDRFGGNIVDLAKARAASTLPILEKDFVFDPYQIVEARVKGADAVLLIADMLDAKLLKELADYARDMGLEPLVEVFTKGSVDPALKTDARVIGINTRNLRTLSMHPENIAQLSALIPKDRLIVAESGIKTAEDVRRLKGYRVKAILVGESLLKQADPVQATKQLAEAA